MPVRRAKLGNKDGWWAKRERERETHCYQFIMATTFWTIKMIIERERDLKAKMVGVFVFGVLEKGWVDMGGERWCWGKTRGRGSKEVGVVLIS